MVGLGQNMIQDEIVVGVTWVCGVGAPFGDQECVR